MRKVFNKKKLEEPITIKEYEKLQWEKRKLAVKLIKCKICGKNTKNINTHQNGKACKKYITKGREFFSFSIQF